MKCNKDHFNNALFYSRKGVFSIAYSIHGIILAAGLSSRMGNFKPLMNINGKTIIENCIDSMLTANVDEIIVVLGYRKNDIELLLRTKYNHKKIKLAYNQQYQTTDMLFSVKQGISKLRNCDSFFLLPGDMPAIKKETFFAISKAMLSNKSSPKVVFPTLNGRKKHPPLISQSCIPDIMHFNGIGGLRGLWQMYDNEIITVPVDDFGCSIDNDTQEDYFACSSYMMHK